MADGPIYQQRVGAQPTADMPGASAAALGGGVGDALARVGEAASELGAAELAVKRNEEWASASVAFEDAKAKQEADNTHLRSGEGETAAPGWAGHRDTSDGLWRQRSEQLLEGISDPEVRRRMQVRVAEYGSANYASEGAFEAGKRLTKFGEDAKVSGDLRSARLLNSANIAADLPREIADLDKEVGGYDIAPDLKTGLLRDLEPPLLEAAVRNRINAADFPTARKMLKEDAFADLGGQRLQQLNDEIDAEQHRKEGEDRAKAEVLLHQQREKLATDRRQLDTGAGKPQDWETLAKGYEAIGDTSSAAEARAKGTEFAAVQGTRDWTPQAMQAQIVALQGKGDLSPAEASTLNGLRTQFAQSQERLGRSGGALEQYLYATGKPIPPIDMNDPRAMAARVAVAKAAAHKYGLPTVEPLLASELPGLRQLMDGGPGEKLQAIETLKGFGDSAAIEGAARQISGQGDGGFRIAARHIANPDGEQLARDILNGPDALKANANIWATHEQDARDLYNKYLGEALTGMGGDVAGDTFDAARAIYASDMTRRGKTGWDASAWGNAVERALGSYKDGQYVKGGTASFQGHRVVIPDGWTGDGVFRRLARIEGSDFHAARATGPGVWPDGSPLYSGQLRDGSLIPVFLGGTRYAFASSRTGNWLGAQGGGPFVLDVAKVPWR